MESQNIHVGTTNQSERESWLKNTLGKIPPGFKILDAGAGERQYEKFCSHLRYISQDFAQYDGNGDNKGLQTKAWDTSKIEIISDIVRIPVEDASFDAVMCIEVFEHLPEPIAAIKEFNRILKNDGLLIITAPFCSLSHLSPHHYYSGFNRYFYEKILPINGFEIVEINANGNYFEYLAQEVRRIPSIGKQYAGESLDLLEKYSVPIILKMLERCSQKDTRSSELLCYGYHVVARKTPQKVAGGLKSDINKYVAEENFWKNEIHTYVKWYTEEMPVLYQTPAPTEAQKVTQHKTVEDNAIGTWFTLHQKVKYMADLQLDADTFVGKNVLDIGSGPMPSAEVFEDAQLFCLDPLYLKYLKLGFPLTGYKPTTKFIPEFAERMSFGDHYFDAVISVNAIDHVDDFEAVAREISRVLKPNGKVRLHAHYHRRREAEPIELNDERMKRAFSWCPYFHKINESQQKTGHTAAAGETYALWSNF